MSKMRFITLNMGLLAANLTWADHPMEEVQVTAYAQAGASLLSSVDTASIAAPDAASMLKRLAGANVNRNGPLTGIPQFRGMFGNRVNVTLDGLPLTSGGPNAMDTPLHYAPTPLVQSMQVYRGVTPVSAGQQTIGGVIQVETKHGEFSSGADWEVHGNAHLSAGSSASNEDLLLSVYVANNQHKVFVTGIEQSADNVEYPEGEINPTAYDRQQSIINYAFTDDGHELSLTYLDNQTDEAGTPALPMDIEYVSSEFSKLAYNVEVGELMIAFDYVEGQVEHGMTNFHMRANSGNQRRAITTADSCEAKLQFEIQSQGVWRVGMDHHCSEHEADISDPTNPMFFVYNFNEVEETITGVFLETQQQLTDETLLDMGVRYNQVSYDSGEVDTSMTMMPTMMGTHTTTLRDRFNNSDLSHQDNNIDWVLQVSHEVDDSWNIYTGISQKMRSATYQERYLWLPMQSTGGLADGHNYIGTPDLDAERAHELVFGFDFKEQGTFISPRLFYREVKDYIQGTPVVGDTPVIAVSTMMGGDANPLQFSNVEAKFYGFDMQWQSWLTDHWGLHGNLSIVRGERGDIDDNLYRVSPDNFIFAVDYRYDYVLTTLEWQVVDSQNRVSETNDEAETAGYALANVHVVWDAERNLKLSGGIGNLFDRQYDQHLGGYNRVSNSDVEVSDRLPGMGRNVYLKLDWTF